MKNWQPASSITSSGWGNFVQPAEVNIFPPVCPRALGIHIILLQFHATPFLEDHPPKILNPKNGSLFNILLPYVLVSINNWIIGLEYHNRYKNLLSQIKSQRNPVLYTLPYESWSPY